jgi:hypothetical protein
MTYTTTTQPTHSIQLGCRVHLTPEQRDQLRNAFSAKAAATDKPVEGRGISVATASVSEIERQLQMDRLTFSSLIGSRESLALPLIARLQNVLGVPLIDEKKLKESFTSYLAFVKAQYGV